MFFNKEESHMLLSIVQFFKESNILQEENEKLDDIIKKLCDNFNLDNRDLIDIQERFKEKSLVQSYSKLITSFEKAEEGITISIDDNIRYANPAFIKMLGYGSLDKILHLGFFNLISKQYYQKLKNSFENRLKGEIVPNIYDLELIRADGTKILVECVNYCMPFHNRNLLVTFYISPKNLKNFETKLLKSEEISRNIIDKSSFLIYQFNLKTNFFDYISPSSIEILGYRPDELTSLEFKKLIDSIHPQDKERFKKHFDYIINQDTKEELNLSIEYRFKHKNLGYRWFDSHHSINFDNKHNPVSIVGNVRDITKCKNTEEELSFKNKELDDRLEEKSIELHETTQNYKNLIDITNTGYLVIDEKGLVIYANPEYVHMSGHSQLEEILGKSIIEWTADYQKDEITKNLLKSKTQDTLGTLNVDFKDKDGKISMIEINTDVYNTEEGSRIIGICHDVTKSKKLMKNLENSKQRLQKFMDSATDGFVIMDSKLNFISVNKTALQVVGMNKEEIIGKNLLDVIPNLRETGRYDEYLNVIKTGKPFNVQDIIFNRGTGSMNYSLSVKAFKTGEDLGMIFTDITDRRKSEKIIKDLAKFPSENPNPVLRATKERILYANDEAKKLFKITEGSRVPIIIWTQIKESITNNSRQLMSLKIRDKIYSISINPIEKMGYANLYGRDVTKQVQAENKLKKSENNLEKRVKELTCLYELSRLFEEPKSSLDILLQKLLDIIQSAFQFPELIKVKIEHDKEMCMTSNFKETKWNLSTDVELNGHSLKINVYYLENIEFLEEEVFLLIDLGRRLKDIIERRNARERLDEAQEQLIRHEKLATIGKLAGSIGHELRNPLGVISNSIYYLNMKLKDLEVDEKVKKHLKIMQEEVVTSNSIISNILDSSRIWNPLFEEVEVNVILEEILDMISLPENIILEKQFNPNIPRLLLDPFQIKLVFRNIVLNAVQAISDGGKLTITSKTSGKMVKIIFKDTGKGITKENLPKIFEPLFSTKVKGIGFGLLIVKDVIENHDGFVKVDSEVDVGTTFTIVLPLFRKE